MTERGLFFVKLSRFAGVSEALAEREPAGEIPSAAEGSLRAGLFSRCATILQRVPFLKSRSRSAGEGCLWSRFAGVSEAGASGSPSAPADGVRVRRRNPACPGEPSVCCDRRRGSIWILWQFLLVPAWHARSRPARKENPPSGAQNVNLSASWTWRGSPTP